LATCGAGCSFSHLRLPGRAKQIGDWLAGKEGLPNAWGAFVFNGSQPHFEGANMQMMIAGTTCGLVGIALAAGCYYWKNVSINTTIATNMSGFTNSR